MRRRKFGNKKIIIDDLKFDSKKEGNRYLELQWLKKEGKIKDFETQPVFKFIVNGILVCKYIADFKVIYPDGTFEIEDVKSEVTRKLMPYRIKKKLMKAIYNIDVLEK